MNIRNTYIHFKLKRRIIKLSFESFITKSVHVFENTTKKLPYVFLLLVFMFYKRLQDGNNSCLLWDENISDEIISRYDW